MPAAKTWYLVAGTTPGNFIEWRTRYGASPEDAVEKWARPKWRRSELRHRKIYGHAAILAYAKSIGYRMWLLRGSKVLWEIE